MGEVNVVSLLGGIRDQDIKIDYSEHTLIPGSYGLNTVPIGSTNIIIYFDRSIPGKKGAFKIINNDTTEGISISSSIVGGPSFTISYMASINTLTAYAPYDMVISIFIVTID